MWTPVCMETTLKYHPLMFDVLTWTRDPGCGQCLVGSLTGAVSPESNGGARRLANPGRTSGG